MKSAAAANTGAAIRSLLAWVLVILVVANIAVWTAWPLRDKLVARGILAPSPAERVDFEPQTLPPIVERVDTAADEQAFETPTDGLPEGEQSEGAELTASADEQIQPPSPTAPEIAVEPSASGPPTPTTLLDCVVFGPLGSQQTLAAAATRLGSTGADVDSLQEAKVDYPVYITPAASRAGARLVLEELHGQAIDAAIIWSGPYENAVSVGVYVSRDRADARRDRIAALGYDVLVRERHYLRARQVPSDALDGLDHEPCPSDDAG